MDQRALEQHLSEVNADLTVGIKYIERRRQIVFLLKEADPRAAGAKRLLQEAEENQAILAAEADRLAKELAALSLAGSGGPPWYGAC
ncbi:hypothetical protein [Reyranella soli]|nr:hypothetical protein [Reyranella soli]